MESFHRAKEALPEQRHSPQKGERLCQPFNLLGIKTQDTERTITRTNQTPPISKLANELKQLPKELQIDLKCIQNFTSLSTKEIQTEEMWRFSPRPVQNGDYQGSNKCWREHGGGDEGALAPSWRECKLVQPPLDWSGGSSKP